MKAFALALLLSLPLMAVSIKENKNYYNSRFGFSLTYPDKIFPNLFESENGDGIRGISSDRAADFAAYGSYSPGVLEKGLKDLYEEEPVEAGRRITYQTISPAKNYYVVSGFEGRKVFYKKVYVTQGTMKALELRYPADSRGSYDPIVKLLVDSFRP